MKCCMLALMLVAVMAEARVVLEPRREQLVKTFGRYPVKGEDYNKEWPWALMEFTELIGRCETDKTFRTMMLTMDTVDIPTVEILDEVCPYAYNIADWLLKVSPEDVMKVEKLFEKVFHIHQCANLKAEWETLYMMSKLTLPSVPKSNIDFHNNIFIQHGDPMFTWCDRVFENIDIDIKEFLTELEQIMDITDNTMIMRTLHVSPFKKSVGEIEVVYRPDVDIPANPYLTKERSAYPYLTKERSAYPYLTKERSAFPYLAKQRITYPFLKSNAQSIHTTDKILADINDWTMV